MNKYIRNQGVTLIELIIVVALIAILLTVAVPSFREIIRNNRLVSQVNSLIVDLNIARSEAIKRGTWVTMCKSADQSNCVTSGNWEQGRIVFVDSDNDGVRDTGEEIIQTVETLSGGNTLRSGGNISNWIAYLPTGLSRGNGGLTNDTFSLCDSRGGSYGRFVVLNAAGRPRTEIGTGTCP